MRPPRAALGVVAFWRAAGFDRWFTASPTFDALTAMRLGRLHADAAAGLLGRWEETPVGTLALLILLDQAPRNLFRGAPLAFATDARALAVATRAIARRFDRRVEPVMRRFFYLPFEHGEDPGLQETSVALFRRLGDPQSLAYAEIHADVIRRFGRFPHRNAILGRTSTKAEAKFLAEGGFSA